MLPSEPLLKHAIACLGVGAVLLLWHAAVSSGAVTAPRAGGDSPLGPTSEGSEPERGERAFRKAPRLPKNQREKGRQVIATVGSAAAVGSAAIAASAAYWVLGGSGLGDLVAAAGIAWATSMRLKASRRLAAASEGDGGGRGMVARDGEGERR